MMTFNEFVEHEGALEGLEEGFLHTGAITAFAARSKGDGDKAVQAFKRGRDALGAGGASASAGGMEQRLDRIEKAVDALLSGLIYQRSQIGNAVAVNVVGHMIASRAMKKIERAARERRLG